MLGNLAKTANFAIVAMLAKFCHVVDEMIRANESTQEEGARNIDEFCESGDFGKMSPRFLTKCGEGINQVGKLAKTMNLVKRAIENKTHIAFWPKRQICFEVQLFYCKSSSTKSLYITCKCISVSKYHTLLIQAIQFNEMVIPKCDLSRENVH